MTPKPYTAGGSTYPDTRLDVSGGLRAGLNALFLETSGLRFVIDPSYFAVGEQTMLADLKLTPGLDGGLESLGVDPATVDYVIITHGHFDHCSGVLRPDGDKMRLRFPNAVHLIHFNDWDERGGLRPEWRGLLNRYMLPVLDAGRLTTFRGADHAVCDRVSLLHAPGETPGHSVVRIETRLGTIFYLGDLIHVTGEAAQIDWAAGMHERDVAQMTSSRRTFLDRVASTGALAIFTHARFPAWGGVRSTGTDSWQWDYAKAVPGHASDLEGA